VNLRDSICYKIRCKSDKSRIFAKNIKKQKNRKQMKFTERIRQLREERQMPQRQFAAALEIDTATYCKIEKGERRVKAEQVVVIADLLQTDKDELLALWLADKVTAVVDDEQKVADKALYIAKKNIKK
jgi:transcriptional regulator with XRE-family HTH domain